MIRLALLLGIGLSAGLAGSRAAAETVKQWDFTEGTHGWQPNPRVGPLTHDATGMRVVSTGADPWITGPRFDCPRGKWAFVTVRLKAAKDDLGEVFYGKRSRAGRSVSFPIRGDGKWHDYRLFVPHELGPGVMLRLDPGMDKGVIEIASITVETLEKVTPPPAAKPRHPSRHGAESGRVASGTVAFVQHGSAWGAFAIHVDGAEMAAGYDGEVLGVRRGEGVQWVPLSTARTELVTGGPRNTLALRAVVKDESGAAWTLVRTVSAGTAPGTLVVEIELTVDRDGEALHVPWLTLLPGFTTFGSRKHQGVFAGIEYLCDEPSSSEADVAAPKHVRRVPAPIRLAYPFMAIEHDRRTIGIVWDRSERVAPIFDSPDRIFGSGAHVMGLAAPAVGDRRLENELFAHSPFPVKARQPIRAKAMIIGGTGRTIVPAVKQYVALRGFPAISDFPGGYQAALQLLSHGWLDSACNEEGVFRHAVWQDKFRATHPAAEAIMFIDWLAGHVADGAMRARLEKLRDLSLSKHRQADPFAGLISHPRVPSAPFVFGRLPEFVAGKLRAAEDALARFDEKGIKAYRPRPGKPDYGRTHFAKHANGFAAPDVAAVLYAATLTGDASLRKRALALLDKQTALYANTVPRGAQTWEMPLHTPDILASAYLVKAYVLGYLLSDDRKYLEQARYWAWTGVPFLYLDPPVKPGQTGAYATTAVLGATNWQAPYWIGLPVQWCGLSYASALHWLSDCDSDAPWATIAKGITAAGLRMSWPTTDRKRQGLLPDFFYLNTQLSAGPAINPGTVQAHIAELFGKGKLYDLKKLRTKGWLVHAPCAIRDARDGPGRVEFSLDGWADKPFTVLVAGTGAEPAHVQVLREKGAAWEPLARDRREFHADHGFMLLRLQGRCRVAIE